MRVCATKGCRRPRRTSKAELCNACREKARRVAARNGVPRYVHVCKVCGGHGHNAVTCKDAPPSVRKHRGRVLTPRSVAAIRRSKEPCSVLAARYGVTPQAISHVRTGRTWALSEGTDGNT